MEWLAVFYDSRCGLCTILKNWIQHQQPLLKLRLIARDSEQARRMIGSAADSDDLVILANTGELWRGNHAWLMVLWALKEYRSFSHRLASPIFLPLARQAFAVLTENRAKIS